MKYTGLHIAFAVGALSLTVGCSEFLVEENIYYKDNESFYSNTTEVTEGLVGIYSALHTDQTPSATELLMTNIIDDICLGGGGPNDTPSQNMDGFDDPFDDIYHDSWLYSYAGIFRANSLIEGMDQYDYADDFSSIEEAESFKSHALAEAYFMRGLFYMRLVRLFGGVPLMTSSDSDTRAPRASYSDTFAQVFSDFKRAIELFPDKKIQDYTLADWGRANKWVAEGYIARAFLYYTGYMTNIEEVATTTAPLVDGGTLDKSDILIYLEDCIKNSGHSLVPDFRNIWPYSYVNKVSQDNGGGIVSPWAEAEGLNWAGQEGVHSTLGTGNPEIMFSTTYTMSTDPAKTNRAALFFSLRINATCYPYSKGWGYGQLHSTFVDDWDDSDPRKRGTVLDLREFYGPTPTNIAASTEGNFTTTTYTLPDQMDYTGLYNRKYVINNLNISGTGNKSMWSYIYNNFTYSFQLWGAQDYYMMRFSDVMLMHSEMSETNTYLNKVRQRAGLADVAYSLDAIKKERLYEFAGEGIRWFDIVRWGDVDSSGDEVYYNTNIPALNSQKEVTYSTSYRPETKALWPIPETEIAVANGIYEQNPGW